MICLIRNFFRKSQNRIALKIQLFVPCALAFRPMKTLHKCCDGSGQHPIKPPKQSAIWFEIFMRRRASKNIDMFKKDTFRVYADPGSSLHYMIKQYDGNTKDHQMDQVTSISAFIPEIPDSKFCPVYIFQLYQSKLDPKSSYFRQYPKSGKNADLGGFWHFPTKIGFNPLATIMSKMSHTIELSKVYTNHSIWVTGATFLHRNNYTPKQIMSITGHKLLNALAIYQKVLPNEKLCIGCSMTYFLNTNQPVIMNAPPNCNRLVKIAAKPNPPTIQPAPPMLFNLQLTKHRIVPYENEEPFEDIDYDIEAILHNIQEENTTTTNHNQMAHYTQSTSIMKQTIKKSPPNPCLPKL